MSFAQRAIAEDGRKQHACGGDSRQDGGAETANLEPATS